MTKPRSDLVPNTADYENLPLVTANGFREYDARWLFGKELNLTGVQLLGLSLGTFFHERGITPKVLTETLRAMERDGLVSRTAYPEIPPRVEYRLTYFGKKFEVVLKAVEKLQAEMDAER